ncbi:thioesterase domain-containing protein [Streptomyces sp. M19]
MQYPGRQDRWREPPIEDLHLMADRIADALDASAVGRRRAFFGHSMGAVLAYEVALRLGPGPRRRACSSSPGRARPPGCGPNTPPTTRLWWPASRR